MLCVRAPFFAVRQVSQRYGLRRGQGQQACEALALLRSGCPAICRIGLVRKDIDARRIAVWPRQGVHEAQPGARPVSHTR